MRRLVASVHALRCWAVRRKADGKVETLADDQRSRLLLEARIANVAINHVTPIEQLFHSLKFGLSRQPGRPWRRPRRLCPLSGGPLRSLRQAANLTPRCVLPGRGLCPPEFIDDLRGEENGDDLGENGEEAVGEKGSAALHPHPINQKVGPGMGREREEGARREKQNLPK